VNSRIIGISDCIVSRNNSDVLVTYALGSCVAVLIHDPVAHIAGLLHYMLPEASLDRGKAADKPFMFADTGVPKLFHQAYDLGASKQRLIVSAVGGAQVLDPENTFDIGKRNQLALRKLLWKAGILLHHQDLGGTSPRTVSIQVQSGQIVVSRGREQHRLNPNSEDKARLCHVS
jgi:chemotaxis protein CheD